MKSKDRVNLDFMPDKTINVDFVAYPRFCLYHLPVSEKEVFFIVWLLQ